MAQSLKGICVLLMAQIFMGYSSAVEADSVPSAAKAFKKLQLVPNVIPKAPKTTASVEFPSGMKAQLGNELTPTQVKCMPTIKWEAEEDALYLIAMFDPDVPSRADPSRGPWDHWLVGNVPSTDISQGEILSAFVSSAPGNGTGLHRYTFLVYKQPEDIDFDEPKLNNTSTFGRANFAINDFVEKYELGTPVAGNTYQAKYDDYVPTVYKQLRGQAQPDPCTTSC